MKSPLAMARRYIKLALAGVGITSYEDLEGFPKRWYMDWLWHDPLGCPAPDLDDLFRLADWAGVDPFEMIAGHEPSSVWHKYTEERPPEGARVLCNLCGCADGMESISTRVESGISRIWTMRSARQISSSARGRRCSRNNG